MPHLNTKTRAHFNGYSISTDKGNVVAKRLEFLKHLALDSKTTIQMNLYKGATQILTILRLTLNVSCRQFGVIASS